MLNYRMYGDLTQSIPPVVVLHGLLGSLENWNTFANHYSTKRPVVALDMRNHGHSEHVEGMSYPLMVEDIMQTLRFLQIESFDLIGHSMGGKAGMLLALQGDVALKRLVVVDIAPVTYPPHLNGLLRAMNALPLETIKLRKEADELLKKDVKSAFERGFLLKNLSRQNDGQFKWLCHLPEITRDYLKIAGFPSLDKIYTGEVRIIAGGQSDYVTPTTWQAAQTYFPNAQLRYIEAAGHLPHVQTPEAFIALVSEFLD